jgi:hypothetical protein
MELKWSTHKLALEFKKFKVLGTKQILLCVVFLAEYFLACTQEMNVLIPTNYSN